MKIYVTGCARSGTTLLGRLFYAFKDVTVIDPEIDLDVFVNASGVYTEHYSGKRSVATIFSNILSDDMIRHQKNLIKLHGVKIVNIIRSGRDVVHVPEVGTQCSPARWIACMDQSRDHRDIISAQVRYEDIVTDPDGIQNMLARNLRLEINHKWSDYPKFVPDRAFQTLSTQGLVRYAARKIEPSVHNPDEYKKVCMPGELDRFEYWLARYEQGMV